MKKTLDKIYTSVDGSIVEEKDFLVIMDAGCENKTIIDFLKFVGKVKKPIAYVFLTHFHWDHVDNLPIFKKYFPYFHVVGHTKNPKVKVKVNSKKTVDLNGTKYVLIPTPGHSEKKDDLCIYLPKEKVLFSGDIIQPQGFSYEKCNFSTCVPYFEFGEDYLRSLKKLLKLDIEYVITGHGEIRLKNSIRITLEVVERIKQLAKEITKSNKKLSNDKICEEIFKQIASERGFKDVDNKLRDPYYYELDRKGLLWFVKNERNRIARR
jgi:glyoxylase-like metal-dependent hydrolase (beta-lactamase superfamily II)